MEFNNAIEKKIFKKKWEKLRKEYEAAGMSSAAIERMYLFDSRQFNAERRYAEHNIFLEELREDGEEGGELPAILANKYPDQVTSSYDTYGSHSRYWWFQEIEPLIDLNAVSRLTDEEKELLTLVFKDGYTQEECAVILHINQGNISRRIQKILDKIHKK